MNTDNLKAYELIEKRYIKDLNSESYLLRHKKTGARVSILENDDSNKVFYIGFRTPPKDSTGVAHIIEHTVLCGSKKYPSKDPFIELAKGSLNTFLNAMTFPDKTVYPIASCNDKDFKNLMDVYLDAVFHPNIYSEKKIFMQEGWHYELEDADAPLKYNGVVYNEMKGAFSSADDVLSRETMNALYPDTAYGVESGGDPTVIPELTYDQFLDFHRTYYHPSNSYIYLYGNADMEERLEYLDKEYLSDYDKISVDSFPGEQSCFSEPRFLEKDYPISEEEDEKDNTYYSYNVVIDKSLNQKLYLAFQIIDYALVEAQGTPVKKALLDKNIGSDIYSMYENGIYQPYFSIVSKGANKEDKDEFISTIQNALRDVVKTGIDKNALRAGLNSLEFRYRESDFGNTPRGLILGLASFDSWLYDDNLPYLNIECNETFSYLRKMIDTDYFEKLVEEYLINNNHKVIITLNPKNGLTAIRDKELASKLEAYKATLSPEEIERIVNETKELLEYQETPDSPEILACIPRLTRSDLTKETIPFDNEILEINGIKTIYHDIFTNEIAYVRLAFNVDDVPYSKLPYLGLLQNILGCVDTNNYGYEAFGYECDMHTGGIETVISAYTNAFNNDDYHIQLIIKARAFEADIPYVIKLSEEMIFGSKFDDHKRIKEIISEIRSHKSASALSAGHRLAYRRALSYISEYDAVSEQISGYNFFKFIEYIDDNFDELKEDITANLKELVDYIFDINRIHVDFNGSKNALDSYMDKLTSLTSKLSSSNKRFTKENIDYKNLKEGFTSSSQVNYVALAGNYSSRKLPYTGALRVMKTIMGYEYLWGEVRVKGGAYGCMSGFTRSGYGFFVSYRDPNIERTIDIYKKAESFLRDFDADEDTMTKYIIGTVSEMDTPLTPKTKGDRSYSAYLSKLSIEDLQKERNEVLNCTADDIRKLADYLKAITEDDTLCVVGNEVAIDKCKEIFNVVSPLIS